MSPSRCSRHSPLRATLDIVGATSAVLCAVHCIATGMLVAVLPLLGASALLGETVERGFLAVAVVMGTFSIGVGLRAHRQRAPAVLLLAGLASLLAVRPLFGEGTLAEALLVVTGAVLLVAAHWRNLRAGRVAAASFAASSLGR